VLVLAGCAAGGSRPAAAPPPGPSQRLYREGQAALLRGDLKEASGRFRSSLEIAREGGNREGVASNLHALAMVDIQRKRWREAMGHMEKALAMDRDSLELGRKNGLAKERIRVLEAKVVTDLIDLARLHRRLYEPRAAVERLREALAIDLRLGRDRGAAITHNNIGRLLLALDDIEEAERHFKSSLRLFEKLKDEKSAGAVRRNLEFLGQVRRQKTPAGG